MLLELGQVAIGVTQPASLAQPDTVDDAGVIERIGNDRILIAEHGLEQSAVGVPARGIQDGVFGAEKSRQRRFELLVHRLRTADETYRGHAIAEAVDGAVRGLANCRMAGKSQVIVSAQVDDIRVVGANLPALGAGDHPFRLEQTLLVQLFELCIEAMVKGVVHASPGENGIERNYTGSRHGKCARKRSDRGRRRRG